MIDYFNITVAGDDFPAIGKVVRTKQPGGVRTKSFTEVKVRADKDAPHFVARLETRAQRMRFSGSPASFLQCHNGLGSNDFPAVVCETVRVVFETLKLPCPASIGKALASGNYHVYEVHVAEQYSLHHALIGPFCDSIRRSAVASLEATPLQRGIGLRLWPNSRDRQVLIYDKYHYFIDGLKKHKRKLLGNMPMDFDRIGTSLYFDKMMNEFLAQGIRMETRLKRMLSSKKRPLNRGSLWTPETAREVHSEMLKQIPLGDLPSLSAQEQLLSEPDVGRRSLIAHWLAGHEPARFCTSPATYFRHRAGVLKRHGIDLSVPALPSTGISWGQLISAESLIEPPEWAFESGFAYEPRRWTSWANPTQNERAWLRPIQEST